MQQPPPSKPVDLSPGATTVAFDPVIPLLRVPVQARPEDEPSQGRWVLAFKDETSRRKAWLDSQDKIARQCEAGARMGCSISATNACRIPWWKSVLVFLKAANVEGGERERCEENEMRGCMAASEESCSKYARETCEPVFVNSRIADPEQDIDPRFTRPFIRRRWTKDVKVSSSETGCAQDPEFPGGKRTTADYRESVMVDKEPTVRRSEWEGPNWTEEIVEVEKSAGESTVDSWEGGLIRPKLVDHSSVQNDSAASDR
ncbi:hypothetical protein R1sor_015132 [Riccia sorocarpa]|uniref:Uncharacterized protein n=1 Tax=Riccia sorocarpa TaxID=122646 RepID=A0ABD3HBW1_9MARC